MRISLKAARIDKDLRQVDVAVAVGVDKKTVGAWENGKSLPTADKIEALCAILGRTYDEIRWNA